MEYLLSIDAGTTSFKGAIFDKEGNLVVSASAGYELITTEGGVVEFEASGYLKALKTVISDLFEKSNINPNDIKGIAIDSQGETLILIDDKGHPLCNAIVWLDGRAVEEADEISERFGVEKVFRHTGQPEIAPTWPACKLLWIKKNYPEIFKKLYKVLLLEDFLIYTLTGKFAAEKSLLTSTIYFDINSGGWWMEMLDFIGLSEEQLPEIYDSGVPVSSVAESVASEFGLSAETMVVTGALDQLSGMIGSGAVGSGGVCESTGTCLAVCVDVPELPKFNPDYQIPCHAGINGSHMYQIYWSQTAGAVLEWFKNNFYKDSQGDVFALMNEEAAGVAAGSDGLIVLPHLSGKACPEFNPYARGVLYGMKLMHGRSHFTRAIMESVAYMLREHLETAETNGILIDEIRSLGGGANSPLWNQIKADVTSKRIITLENSESTCLGTAILAGVGTGVFNSVESAALSFAKAGRIYEPNSQNREIYNNGYVKYKEMYEKLKDSFSG